jgi:geranylgeranyl reductase family protein
MKTEAAIIGAGPAGLIAADIISRHGYSVEVFEEHNLVGYPVHCAGMVSVEGFNRLGVEPDPTFHQNTVYGGRVFSADGNCIKIKDKKPRAYVIDRGRFDAFLADRVWSQGGEISLGKRVEKILFKEGHINALQVGNSKFSSKIIIDTEGARGRLLLRSGVDTVQKGILNGYNVELKVEIDEPDMVEVWFNQEIAKDFFTWVVPISESSVRCGLATSRSNGADALKHFIWKRFEVEIPREIHGGLICTGGPVNKTVYPGLVLAGDVAGQVKPTTGGGVVIGGLCAKLAGETSVKALEYGYSLHRLNNYEEEWRSLYGSELQAMLYIRMFLNRLDDERICRMFHTFAEGKLEEKFTFTTLVMEGDMDMQAGIIKRALTDPAILGSLVKSLGRLAIKEILAAFGF